MFETAKLHITNFETTLTLRGEGREPKLINVIGDRGPDWEANPYAYLRRAADDLLSERGYTRSGDWTRNVARGQYIATIAAV